MNENHRNSWGTSSLVLIAAMAVGGGIADWRAKLVASKEIDLAVTSQIDTVLKEVNQINDSQFLLTFMESSLEAVVAVDKYGNVIAWSDGAEALLGVKREEAMGYGLAHLIPPYLRSRHIDAMRKAMQSASPKVSTIDSECDTPTGRIPITIYSHTIPDSMSIARIVKRET